MLRLLHLPCALLALLLSALGGVRLAAIEPQVDERGKAPMSSPAPVVAALPSAPAPIPGPAPTLMASVAVIETAAMAVLVMPVTISLPAPSQRRGSAGGARAP